MPTKAKTQTDRPQPPDDLDHEAVLEWHRVTEELDAIGLLDRADRAVLTIYCQTWAVWQSMTKPVSQFGAVVKMHNGVAGQSPFWKEQKEAAKLLRGFLADLGLTPTARHKMNAAKQEEAEDSLDF
jgi:P27 family predicted phage terminase small subunit